MQGCPPQSLTTAQSRAANPIAIGYRSLDPHRNLFFYYAGSAKAVDGRDRQLEDNTTKALVNLLELTTHWDPEGQLTDRFLSLIGASPFESDRPEFALQRSTIGAVALERANEKLLLGIAPRIGEVNDLVDLEERSSRPDAWLWTRSTVVCIETKVVGTFGAAQLAAHARTLGPGTRQQLLTWRSVYAFFADQLADARQRRPQSPTAMLLTQFVEYLRIIAYRQEIDMGVFDGFRPEHFAAFSFRDQEDARDNQRRVKHYLAEFVSEVRHQLPPSVADFTHQQVGNLRPDGSHAWSTLSRRENPVHEAHFSFAIESDEFGVRLLIEGQRPALIARHAIEQGPEQFLDLLQKLPEWRLKIRRRWQVRPRKFSTCNACTIELDSARRIDVDYIIQKVADLERKAEGQGFFQIVVERSFEIGDPKIRTKAFAHHVAVLLESLVPLEQFLSRP